MNDIIIDIGKKIRAERKNKGWSQQFLGEKVGSYKDHISKLESGKINPTIDYLIKIAEALGINFKDLVK
jgi:transcriptional regulator with XRE-family HTH domain